MPVLLNALPVADLARAQDVLEIVRLFVRVRLITNVEVQMRRPESCVVNVLFSLGAKTV